MFLNFSIVLSSFFILFQSNPYFYIIMAIIILLLCFLFIVHRIKRAHFPTQTGRIREGIHQGNGNNICTS